MALSHEERPAPVAPSRSAWVRLLPVLALVAAAWFGVGWLTRAEHRPALVEGQVPPLQMTAFDGSPIDLGTLRGHGVVINFWASWCAPCRVEAEIFEAAWRTERERGIVFVGVNHQDTPAAAQAFIEEFDVSYPNGADSEGTWSRSFGVAGLPTTFFVDPQGEIQAVVWGPITTAGELAHQLDKIRPETR